MTRPTPDPLRAADTDTDLDDMCPNCVTPWKCNGPHLVAETPYMRRLLADNRGGVGCWTLLTGVIVLLEIALLSLAVLVVIATPRSDPRPNGSGMPGPAPTALRDSALRVEGLSGAPQPSSAAAAPAVIPMLPTLVSGTAADVTWQGTISYVSASFGPRYLALPLPVGTRARICGPAACLTRTSTDYGPDQRVNPDRIADVSAADFPVLCGVPLRFGLCSGSVTIERRAGLQTLPPTSTTGGTE